MDAKDLMAMQRHLLRHQGQAQGAGRRRMTRLLGWAFVAVVGVVAFLYMEELAALNAVDFLTHAFFIVLGLLVITFVWQFLLVRRLAQAMPKESVLELTSDGVRYDDQVTEAFTRWSAVDHIAQAKSHLFIVFRNLGGYAVPRRVFPDGAKYDAVLEELRRYCPDVEIDPAAEVDAKASRRRRWAWIAIALLTAMFALVELTPWRRSVDLSGTLGSVDYMVAETGGAAADAALPLIIDLHPYGGFPELMSLLSHRRPFAARFVYPAGDYWHIVGASWFSFDHDMATDARLAADRIAAFTKHVMRRYPTQGRPIVTGFSQGGSMAYALAAYHPDLFVAAVPFAGALPGDLPKRAAVPGIVVRAFHGADDKIVPADWARYTTGQMQKQGWDVTLQEFPGVTHKPSSDARAAWNKVLADFAAAQAAAK